MLLNDYVAPPADAAGDNLNPSEVLDRTLVVQPLKVVTEVPTKFGTKDALSLNVADVTADRTYRSVLWFNGAVVDGLRQNIGQTLAVRLERSAVSKTTGNAYITVSPVDAAAKAVAAAWLSANPVAFAPEVGDPAPADGFASPAAEAPAFAAPAPAPVAAAPAQVQVSAPAAAAPSDPVATARQLIAAGLADAVIAQTTGLDLAVLAALRNAA